MKRIMGRLVRKDLSGTERTIDYLGRDREGYKVINSIKVDGTEITHSAFQDIFGCPIYDMLCDS